MSLGHTMRSLAKEIFLDALNEAGICEAFERHVSYDRGVLRVCDDLYDLNRTRACWWSR